MQESYPKSPRRGSLKVMRMRRRKNPIDFGLVALSALGGAFATAIFNNLDPGLVTALPPLTLQLVAGSMAATASASGGVITVVAPSGGSIQSVSIVGADGQTPIAYTPNPATPANQSAQQLQGNQNQNQGTTSSQSWTFATTAQTATATVTWTGATGTTGTTGTTRGSQNQQGQQQTTTIALTLV